MNSDGSLRILILDDDTKRAVDWATFLNDQDGISSSAPGRKEVESIIEKIHERRVKGRDTGNTWRAIDCDPIDQADLLIVDYDLLGLDNHGEWTTGAEIAYTARLVSSVGPILLVNQHGTNPFDLTMRQTINSKADWDVGSDQIVNPGLWSSSGFFGFRPWSWPNLKIEPSRFKKAYEFIKDKLDDPIAISLGFDTEHTAGSRHPQREAWAWLGIPTWDTTFRELVVPKPIDKLGEKHRNPAHLIEKDLPIVEGDNEQIALICTSIILRWLERVVLPNQDTLADAPHLAYQMPWLLRDWNKDITWHTLESLGDEAANCFQDELAAHRFKPACLFSRPIYWAEEIRENGTLRKPAEFDFSLVPNLVFREDVSNFGPRQDSIEFPTDLPAVDNRRWISDRDKATSIQGSQDVKQVIYEPQSYLLY